MIQAKQKQRWVGSEAPAVRVKMVNGEEKVIGMMAEKIQLFIFLPFSDSLTQEISDLIKKYQDKALIYTISSQPLHIVIDQAYSTTDFYKLSLKYGVNIDETQCAKAIFIINKEGEIVYKDILNNPKEDFVSFDLEKPLLDAINFKQKGHTHENWMGV